MSYIKNIVKQTAIYGLSSIVGRLLNYLLIPYYTRVFSPEQYGVVTDLYSLATIFIVLLTYGMETTIFRFINKNREKEKEVIDTAFTSLFISSTIFIIFGIVFKDYLSDITGYKNNKDYILYFIFILGIDSFLSIPFAYLRYKNKSVKFSVIKIINILSTIFFNILFLIISPYFGYNTIDIKYIFISNLLATIITLVMFFSILKNFSFKIDFCMLKKMLKYGIPILIAGLAGIINESMDRQFLKYLLPRDIAIKEIGIYGACYKISIILTLFIQAFRMGVEPFFFKKSNHKEAKEIYAEIMLYFVMFISCIYLIINTNIEIIKYFVGEKYREGIKIVPLILLANLFFGIYTNMSIWYKVIDKTIFGVILSFVGVFFTTIINIIFIPKYGYVASAWATLIAYFSMMVFSYFLNQKYYKINYDLNSIIKYIFMSILFSYIFIFFNKNYVVGLILNILLLTLLYNKSKKLWKKNLS